MLLPLIGFQKHCPKSPVFLKLSLCTALSVNWIGKYPVSDYRKSSIKFPLSNKPNLSNKPPPSFQGKKVNKPLSALLFFTNKW